MSDCDLVAKRFTMYCNDPEIRRFAIESLMQAALKTGGGVRLTESRYEMLAALRYYLRQYLRFSEVAARAHSAPVPSLARD